MLKVLISLTTIQYNTFSFLIILYIILRDELLTVLMYQMNQYGKKCPLKFSTVESKVVSLNVECELFY